MMTEQQLHTSKTEVTKHSAERNSLRQSRVAMAASTIAIENEKNWSNQTIKRPENKSVGINALRANSPATAEKTLQHLTTRKRARITRDAATRHQKYKSYNSGWPICSIT